MVAKNRFPLNSDCFPWPLDELYGPDGVSALTIPDVVYPMLRQMGAVAAVLHIASSHQVVPEDQVTTIAGWLEVYARAVLAILRECAGHREDDDQEGGAL